LRIGILGDTHYTNKKPARRLDDFWETQKRKTRQALGIFNKRGCDCVIQVGDTFDNPMVSYSVVSELIEMFRDYENPIFVVFGQHDLFGHSSVTLPNSPIKVLESAQAISILTHLPNFVGFNGDSQGIQVYGAGFGQEIPKPNSHTDYNVLVTHRMIGDRPLFPDQELENPVQFLKTHPEYNLIVAGDYHYRFISRYQGRVIVNPGALVRKSISQFDLEHEPAVMVFETTTGEIEVVKLDIEPVDRVFDMTPVQKRDDSKLAKFIEDLRKQHGESDHIGWRHRLIQTMDEKGCSAEARRIIDQALEEIHK